jgi:hypothetical protein
MRKLPGGHYAGMITLVPTRPLPSGHPAGKPIRLVAKSRTKAGALAKAASVAEKLLKNPILSSVMPPGTGAAIKAVSFLSKSAAAGKLEKAAKKYVGKGAKRLFKSLSSLW